MFPMKSLSFLFIVLSLVTACSHQAKRTDCLEKHGALDIGSGSTKAVAAIVDVCEKKIERILYEDQISLGFSETAEKTDDRGIPSAFLREAVEKIRPLSDRLKALELKSISGVATSAFRTAKNGNEIVASLSRQLNIPIEVISQEAEARLGYWSAVAKRPDVDREQIVVWDIGGGSMQMIAFDEEGTHIFQGEMAAVTFKNQVLRQVLKKILRNSPRRIRSGLSGRTPWPWQRPMLKKTCRRIFARKRKQPDGWESAASWPVRFVNRSARKKTIR